MRSGDSATPQISVVLPVHEPTRPDLDQTLESLLEQRGVELEIVVVDDGSGPEGRRCLEAIAGDSRIRLVRQEWTGITGALRHGCAQARGELVARQDLGDRSLPGRLRAQHDALLADPELVFVSCWTRFLGPEAEYLYDERGTGRAVEATRILDLDTDRGVIDGPSHHGSVMFRRAAYERVGGYRAPFSVGQDWDLWYRLAEVGKFRMMPEALYEAEVRPAGISGQRRSEQLEAGRLAREALRRRQEGADETPVLEEAARLLLRPRPAGRRASSAADYFIGECLRRNGDRRARKYLVRALRSNPLAWKAWVRWLQAGAR